MPVSASPSGLPPSPGVPIQLRPIARVYAYAVTALGLAACVAAAASVEHWLRVGFLCALMIGATSISLTPVRWVDQSLGLVVAVASFTIVGWAGATLVCAVGAAAHASERRGVVKRAFNFGQLALSGAAGGALYELLGGPVGAFSTGSTEVAAAPLGVISPSSSDFPRTLWVVLASVLIYSLVNTALTSGVIALVERLAPVTVMRTVLVMAPSSIAYGGLGLMLAVLWIDYEPVSSLLLFLPLLSARWAIRQYSEQQKAYDSTLRALITTIEVKDGYTGGHSERVSRIAIMIARECHMPEYRVDAVRYAALLHDVGKTGIPTSILGKHGKLTDDEFDVIKTHPDRGVRMLDGIDFLSESLSGVYHHHERMDGRGYPLGLVGSEIPEFARIVMVADAFDAMTSTRSYRPARSVDKAIVELRRCEGEQFDPWMVDALVRALDKQGWEGDPEPFSATPPGVEAPAAAAATETARPAIPAIPAIPASSGADVR